MATPQPWRRAADGGKPRPPRRQAVHAAAPAAGAPPTTLATHGSAAHGARARAPGATDGQPTRRCCVRPGRPHRRRGGGRCHARCPPPTQTPTREPQRTSTTDTIESELIVSAARCTPPPDAASQRRPAADAKRAATRPPRRPRVHAHARLRPVGPLPATTQGAPSRAARRSAVGCPTAPPPGGTGDDGRALPPPRRGRCRTGCFP